MIHINWVEEIAWSTGTAPSTPMAIGVHVARKGRAPTIKELMLMAGVGTALDRDWETPN